MTPENEMSVISELSEKEGRFMEFDLLRRKKHGWQPSTAKFGAVTRSKVLIGCVALVYRSRAKEGVSVRLAAYYKIAQTGWMACQQQTLILHSSGA